MRRMEEEIFVADSRGDVKALGMKWSLLEVRVNADIEI
jgi:hypothetical protein